MLPRVERLSTKAFAKAFAGGKTARHPLLSLRVWRRLDEKSDELSATKAKNGVKNAQNIDIARAAFVVPKKQAKAAKRNKLRRRMRECYRQHPILAQRKSELAGCDLIFVATPAAHSASWDELNEAFAQLLRRATRLSGESSSEARRNTTKSSLQSAVNEPKS
jgi:ribonuclease P protein component